jgi:dienelactone hydrolase
MRIQFLFALIWLLSLAAAGQSTQSIVAQTVEVPIGSLRLKAFLWMPAGSGPFRVVLFNHGSGGADAMTTAEMPITKAAEELGPLFLNHGYAFLYLFRRGQGLSANQAPFMQDVLQHEEQAKGKEARQHLQFILLTTEQLDDVTAALSFLKTLPEVDANRIAVVGHSFGGQLTLLAAERDSTIRAVVTFGAAANSWERSPELRERLLTAVRKTSAPIMLIHAANDYSTAAGSALAAELDRLQQPHLLKIYPSVGQTVDDGHNMLYKAIPQWEGDVFKFLDENVRR